MTQEPLRGVDLNLAASARELQRDYRTLGQRWAAQCRRPPVLGIACWVLAGLVWFYPAVVDGAVVMGLIIGVIGWRQRPQLPLKLPDRYAGLDPHQRQPGTGKPQSARGLLFLGNDRADNAELYHSDDDARTHFLVLGGTGSGKTEAMTSLAAQTLLWGSGYTYVDGKGDAALWTKAFALARACGREDDLYVLNYMTGSADIDPDAPDGPRLSHTFNPFLHGSADAITQLLVSQMAEAGGDSGPWKDKAIGLLTAYVRALVALRDRGFDEQGQPFVLEVSALRHYLTLDNLIHLYLCAREQVGHFTIPATALDALHSYLESVPGFQDPVKLMSQHKLTLSMEAIRARTYPGQPDPQTYLQHGYLQNQFNRMFNQMADVYGHIFRAGHAEIDLTDVVLQRRILVVMLPALEKSPDELANLGKLLISSLKAMLAVGLGAQLEGTHRAVIERRPTAAPSPYLGVFDEYGYYAVKGFAVVPAQARSLGFSVCFGGQDIQSFGKQSKEEADAIVGNTLTKIAMKIEDPKDTMDLFEKVAGQTIAVQTSGFTRGHSTLLSGLYRDVPNATLERRVRIDPLDLRAQQPGEAYVFFGTTIVRAHLFYAGEFKAREYRLNRFVPLVPVEIDLHQRQRVLTPEGLRAAVAEVVNAPLDEVRLAHRLMAISASPGQHMGDADHGDQTPNPTDFARALLGNYVQSLEWLDREMAEALRAIGRPDATLDDADPDQTDGPAAPAEVKPAATQSGALEKHPVAQAEPAEPVGTIEPDLDAMWDTVCETVDTVIREAEAGADHPAEDSQDMNAVGVDYHGLIKAGRPTRARERNAGTRQGNDTAAVRRLDADFPDAPPVKGVVTDRLELVDAWQVLSKPGEA